MLAAVTAVWALLLGILLLMLGNGLQSPLISLRASMAGFPSEINGLIMSGYFVGFLAGSFLTPRLVAAVGHIRVFGALASIASAAALLYAVMVDEIAWLGLRIVTGFAFAGIYIAAESWLNDRATNQTRGQLFAVYMVVSLGAMTAGPLLLNLGDPAGQTLFIVISVLVSLALVPVALTTFAAPDFQAPRKLSLLALYRASPLGVIGSIGAGASASALIGMTALFGQEVGMSVAQISFFAAAAVLGGMVLQWPIGRLSDRYDRRQVLTAVNLACALVAVGGVAVVVLNGTYSAWLLVAIAMVGGLSFPVYSLSIAHTNDFLEHDQMVAASSGLIMANGIGGIIGPIAVGSAIGWIGAQGYFWYFAALHLLIGLFALYRMTRRAARPLDEQRPYVAVAVDTTPVAASAGAESAFWAAEELESATERQDRSAEDTEDEE